MSDSSMDISLADLPPEATFALHQAFGDAVVEHIRPMPGGLSGALLLSLSVDGHAYVLRRPDPKRAMHAQRMTRELECMRIAAQRGIAPALRLADLTHGVSIMRKIDAAPPGRTDAARMLRLADALRHLHAGPAFPSGPPVRELLRHFDGSLRSAGKPGLGALFDIVDGLTQLTARFLDSAPCHCDLNPGNILHTHDAVYFVDWDTAGQGDPFVDIGQLGVFTFSTADQRAHFLAAYCEGQPSELEAARAHVGRVLALAMYAAAFISTTLFSGGVVDAPEHARPLGEVLSMFGSPRPPKPGMVAGALLDELRLATESEEHAAAKRTIASRA